MFACGHVYFSRLIGAPSAGQVIGALLPDAPITGVFGWSDLRDHAAADELATRLADDVVDGIRHHIDLDFRSHDSWDGDTGYAYSHQTEELRELVGRACNAEGDIAQRLAHNFIETGVDIHIARAESEVVELVKTSVDAYDLGPIAEALAMWKSTDLDDTIRRLDEYMAIWSTIEPSTVDGMIEMWEILVPHLRSKFTFGETSGLRIDPAAGVEAIELAVELTATDYRQVLTPG